MKHTPGPWTSKRPQPRVQINLKAIYCENLGYQVAFVNSDSRSIEENAHANARLIAAAPELLDALKEALVQIDNQCDVSVDEWLFCRDKARAAIAKATGETQ
jgi:hypothetical protein